MPETASPAPVPTSDSDAAEQASSKQKLVVLDRPAAQGAAQRAAQAEGERRVALTPTHVEALTKAGWGVSLAAGLGHGCGYTDDDYTNAGAVVSVDITSAISAADVAVCLDPPED